MGLPRFFNRYTMSVTKALVARHSGVVPHGRHLFPVSGYVLSVQGTVRGRAFTASGEWVMPDDRGEQVWNDLESLAARLPGHNVKLRPGLSRARIASSTVSPAALAVLESTVVNGCERLGGKAQARKPQELALRQLKLPTTIDTLTSPKSLSSVTKKLTAKATQDFHVTLHGAPERAMARVRVVLQAAVNAEYRGRLWFDDGDLAPEDAAVLITLATQAPGTSATIVFCDPVSEAADLKRLWDLTASTLAAAHDRVVLATSKNIQEAESVRNIRTEYPGIGIVLSLSDWPCPTHLSRELSGAMSKGGPVWLRRTPYASDTMRATENWAYRNCPDIDAIVSRRQALPWPQLITDGALDLETLITAANRWAVFPTSTKATTPTSGATTRIDNNFEHEYVPGPRALRSMSLREMHALQMGVTVRTLDNKIMLLEQTGSSTTAGFRDLVGQRISHAGAVVGGNKIATRAQFEKVGLPIATGFSVGVDESEKAVKLASKVGFPLVVKPSSGLKGLGITTNIRNPDELRDAFTYAINSGKAHDGVIVEQHVDGGDYRLFVLGGSVVSVLRREPGTVIGDGNRTVLELLIANNVARRRNPHLQFRLVYRDRDLDRALRAQDLTLDSVPQPGQSVALKQISNISQGADSIGVLHETHPSILDLAVKAAAALNMPQAGVDILMPDHRLPADEQLLSITELNSNSGLNAHVYPRFGTSVNVNEKVVRDVALTAGLQLTDHVDNPAVRLTATGHVQGVGFRAWLRHTAEQLGLTGWVRNRDDGTLEAHLQGPIRHIVFVSALSRIGPQRAHVFEVLTEPVRDDEVHGFEIRS